MADEVEEEEEFHTPRGRDLADEPEVEWMYADARVLPLPGLRAMAAANPLRWSRGRPDKIVDELESVGVGWWGGSNEARPVQLRIVGQSYMHKFASAREAAQVCRLVASRAPRLRGFSCPFYPFYAYNKEYHYGAAARSRRPPESRAHVPVAARV